MTTPPKPLNEPERLAALRALCILDTPTEEQYDRLTRKLAYMLDVPIAYLALIDANRQWLKSVVGDMVCEMNRDGAFCAHTILEHQPLIIPDTREDPRFADNPLVTNEPYLRFYAGIPLTSPDGHNVGTLCIADHKPRHLSFDDLELLKAFAALVEEKINHLLLNPTQNVLKRRRPPPRNSCPARPFWHRNKLRKSMIRPGE